MAELEEKDFEKGMWKTPLIIGLVAVAIIVMIAIYGIHLIINSGI